MQNKYYIETYGCQMNVYDSELIENQLMKSGYKKTQNIEVANLIFLNTCAIREKAEDTVHNRLTSIAYLKKRNPKLMIGVVGCMAQNLKDELLLNKPYVDIILGPDSYRKIPEIINNRNKKINHIVDTKLSRYEVYDDLFPSRKEGVNAWISIMRGCDKFCTFCIVPFTRGRERSRPVETIVNEAKDAVANGFVEVTLLGQNVNSYSSPEGDFTYLLEEVAKIRGLKRIRYTSPHPRDFDDSLLETMTKYNNICNYIHLPLQSGSDHILKMMNRTYDRQEFLNLVKKIRGYIPNCSISTDVIVGFPGEKDEEFQETYDFLNELEVSYLHVFSYSEWDHTDAIKISHKVNPDIIKERSKKISKLSNKKKNEFYNKNLGAVRKVLVESYDNGILSGLTENYIRVKIVSKSEEVNSIISLQLMKIQENIMMGHRKI